MLFHAFATDYDGTLAHNGLVSDEVITRLEELRATGRKLLLVTGRELSDLFTTFFRPEIFDLIVAENGAVLYEPATKHQENLVQAPTSEFLEILRRKGVSPLSKGDVIIASREPHQDVILKTIQEMGLELQVTFNKGAVMVLPAGVNKATGLVAALKKLKLSPHNVIGVGDAENDHAFLKACECGVAVANSLQSVKDIADLVTKGEDSAGVMELCAQLSIIRNLRFPLSLTKCAIPCRP